MSLTGEHLPSIHQPVLAAEVLHYLAPRPGQIVVDGTLGGGGHTRILAEAVSPGGQVVAIDRDPTAIAAASVRLAGLPVIVCQANYSDLPEVLHGLGLPAVDAVLLDLGVSSDQLADDQRGFSFHSTGPLDLRFDQTRGEPAWKLLARLSARHLAEILYELGEERHGRRIAEHVVRTRRTTPIHTAAQLAERVCQVVPRSGQRLHPATRTFQALRIAVNDELKWLATALRRIPACMHAGGRLAVISFHSLEDRLVKSAFRQDARFAIITRKPVYASAAEVERNPRSRSARLRVAEIRSAAIGS
jgi:16S rRNA (cytosine1402-N4)-methyltransferase